MNTNKIIKKITDGHIRLPNTTRLKVTDIHNFLAFAEFPYYNVSRQKPGGMWSERPSSLRHIALLADKECIVEDFLAGRLELLDFRNGNPIPVDKASRFNNPFDLSIALDEFVRYAKLRGVTVTVEDDAYFDCLPNEVFLKALDIAGLVLADGGTTPTDEAILNEAHSWVNGCFMGTVICESNEVDINNYAPEQDAVLDIYVIELNSAIELAEILKKPTQRLKERLAQLSLSVPQRVDNSLETQAEALPDDGAGSQAAIELASVKKQRLKGVQDKLRTAHFIEWVNRTGYDGSQTNYWIQDELRQDNAYLWGKNETTFNKWLQTDEAREARELLETLKMQARLAQKPVG